MAGAHCNNSSHSMQSGGVAGMVRIDLCQDVYSRTYPLNPRSADEHGMDRVHSVLVGAELQSLEIEVRFEGFPLPSKSVAANGDIQAAKRLLRVSLQVGGRVCDLFGQQNHARAGAVDRKAVGYPLLDGITEFKDPGQFVDGGGFATGDDQAVDPVQLGRPADTHAYSSSGLDGMNVLTEIALECQDADPEACTHA